MKKIKSKQIKINSTWNFKKLQEEAKIEDNFSFQ